MVMVKKSLDRVINLDLLPFSLSHGKGISNPSYHKPLQNQASRIVLVD